MIGALPTISLPRQFAGATLSTFVADLVSGCPEGWPPEICLDFSKLNFIRPIGAVFLSNLL